MGVGGTLGGRRAVEAGVVQGLRPSHQAVQLLLDQTAKKISPKKDQSFFVNLFSISIFFIRNPDQRRKYVIVSDIVLNRLWTGPCGDRVRCHSFRCRSVRSRRFLGVVDCRYRDLGIMTMFHVITDLESYTCDDDVLRRCVVAGATDTHLPEKRKVNHRLVGSGPGGIVLSLVMVPAGPEGDQHNVLSRLLRVGDTRSLVRPVEPPIDIMYHPNIR